MKVSDQYIIPLRGIKDGDYLYSFIADDKFFEQIDESEIKQGNFKTDVKIERRGNLITMRLNISGVVIVPCDRCLDDLNLSFKTNQEIFIKFGETQFNDNQDYIFLSDDDDSLNIAQYIYEYIILALPFKRVHSNDIRGTSKCNPEMLKILGEYSITNNENKTDNRWNELKKLKNGTS
ncbi:MAG: DUF177 domain-containing protein [Bacteroidota bacterium]